MNTAIDKARPEKAILTPFWDLVCIGGLSALLMAFFLIVGNRKANFVFEEFLILTVLINAPHFMASYRLLYGSRAMVQEYRSASLYVPLFLFVYSVFALWQASLSVSNPFYIHLLLGAVSVYLALHYTGQVWGMMASFSFLEKTPFEAKERNLLRGVLYVLMSWQIIWFLNQVEGLQPYIGFILEVLTPFSHLLAIGSLIFVVYTLFLHSKRCQRITPVRVWIPLCALYLWYAVLYHYPSAIFWVQISHGLQYLIFPLRVEANRYEQEVESSEGVLRHLFFYAITLVGTGYLVFVGFEQLVTAGQKGFEVYPLVLVSCINIHHFYIDGCIWKISNPRVRADLFAHLK